MARKRINSKSKDIMKGPGTVLLSVIDGEQVRIKLTAGWLTTLVGHTITCKIVEADSSALDHFAVDKDDRLPLVPQSSGQLVSCTIIDSDVNDNEFEVVIPENITDNFVTMPLPEKPSYGWIGVEIADTGVGANQQIWKPFRGLVEILYSPTEQV
jgi:hypothetical protein